MIKHNAEKLYIEIGEKIANARKEAGLTQEKFASLLKIRQPVLASYEIGRRRVPVSSLIKMAEVLNVYVEDLLPIENEKRKRGPKSKIDRELEKVKSLPEEQRNVVLTLIESLTKSNK